MKIAFLDPVHALLRERLTAAGHLCLDPSPLVPADAEGLVVRSSRVDAEMMDRSPGLKFIARAGSGLENVDVAHAAARGITVHASPEGNRDGVGETAVLLLLMLLKNAAMATNATRQGEWPREASRGLELHGRTVGVIGHGHMGAAFTERLAGFGVRILAYDKYRTAYAPDHVEETGLAEVMRGSEIISLHLPLNAGTHHFVDAAFIAGMARPFWLINTARGPLVSTNDLVRGLASGKVLGAGLDVLEQERADLSGLEPGTAADALQQLRAAPNVVITPHIAGVTHEGARKMADVLSRKILKDFPHAH